MAGGATRCGSPAKDGVGFGLMAIAEEPALCLVVEIGKGGAGGDHHPPRRFGVVGRAGLPLPFGDEEVAQRSRILLPERGIEALPECLVVCLTSAHGCLLLRAKKRHSVVPLLRYALWCLARSSRG